jgi:hypothetical protein
MPGDHGFPHLECGSRAAAFTVKAVLNYFCKMDYSSGVGAGRSFHARDEPHSKIL